jgi:hypothetical protein
METMTGNRGDLADNIENGALTEVECRALLATRTLGRVGTTRRGLPVITAVRYSYRDDAIIFRTGSGSVADGDVLAFEVGAHDPDTHVGFSVLVVGRATVSSDDVVELRCELVSGERFPAPIEGT